MSENLPEPDLPESDQELESLLKNLQPNPLEFSLLRDLESDCTGTYAEQREHPEPPRWQRLFPLALVGALGMLAYVSFQYGPQIRVSEDVANVESPPSLNPPSVEASPTSASGQFLPVSAQGFLINSSSEGLVETDEGLHEKMNLEYRDAYHWHDPETGTSIRYFQPRSEEIIVPLQTD